MADVPMTYVILQSVESYLYEIALQSKQERIIISLAEAFNAIRVCKDRIAVQNN